MKTRGLLLLFLVGILTFACSESPELSEVDPDGSNPEASSPRSSPAELPSELTITYAPAAEWLDTLPVEDREDQIRDWATVGLAAALDLDVETVRDFFFDKAVVRDPVLRDFATQRVGPGRFLPDGAGTLHLLVPSDDPYLDRTVGMALDDYRTDAGSDLATTRVHRYRIDAARRSIAVLSGVPEPTSAVRSRHGYHSRLVSGLSSLQAFLDETDHLSRLEVRNGEVWAFGWAWPGAPTGQVTAEDLTVLQQAYERAAAGEGLEPGFSLDPGPPSRSDEEFLAMFDPSDRSEAETVLNQVNRLVTALQADEITEDAFWAASAEIGDRERDLTRISMNTWTGDSVYQFARYDGGLEGTEVGMTYFYTDLVAKTWPMDVGAGSPKGQVIGFVTDVDAKTPWSLCNEEGEEDGRLWFGLREEGVAPSENAINLAGLTTRLFSLVQDAGSVSGEEVEPSYHFGRIIHWWDGHYIAIADFEPEYHRLDQLMRWGAAIAWLTNQEGPRLPEVAPESIARNKRLPSWMASRPDLRWRYTGRWLYPRNVETEALPTLHSRGYENCGSTRLWAGGVSGPARARLVELAKKPDLPPGLSRAGFSKARTDFHAATRIGELGRANVIYRFSERAGRAAPVAVTAEARNVWSLGRLRLHFPENLQRIGWLHPEAGGKSVRLGVGLQGAEMGELAATATGTRVTVQWRPGLLDRARTAFHRLEEHLSRWGLEGAVQRAEGSSLSYFDPSTGRGYLRLDGASGARWAAVEPGLPEASEAVRVRLGAPGPDGIRWYNASFTEPPVPRGSVDGWTSILPASGGGPGRVGGSGPPGPGSARFTLSSPDGEGGGTFYVARDRFLVRRDEPVVGLDGAHAGHLFQAGVGERLTEARRLAAVAGDGDGRLVPLDLRRTLLLEGDRLRMIEDGHRWQESIREILDSGDPAPRVREVAGRLESVGDLRLAGPGRLADRATSEGLLRQVTGLLEEVAPRPPPVVYVSDSARMVLAQADIPPAVLGERLQIRVVSAVGQRAERSPGIGAWDGTEWHRHRGNGGGGNGAPGGPAAAGDGSLPGLPPTWYLIYSASDCDDDNDNAATRERCQESTSLSAEAF